MKRYLLVVAGFLLVPPVLFAEPRIPGLSFHPNRGQAPRSVKFLARGDGYNLLLTATGSRLFSKNTSVETVFEGANPSALIEGRLEQPGRIHYLRADQTIIDIPSYAQVLYSGIYPEIDLVYYARDERLEFDFIVHPGADPRRIVLRYGNTISIDGTGNLVIGGVVQQRPVVYQGDRLIHGSYRLLANNSVGFEIGDYDPTQTLIIDPVVSYFRYLGGDDGDDDARAIATDSSGNVYVAGSTTSTTFPTLAALDATPGANDASLDLSDAFVTKLSPTGALVYSTYLGGSNDDDANAIAVDASGNVVVAGRTESTDFPTTAGALRQTCTTASDGTCQDAFVVRLNPSGSTRTFATYLGGTGDEEARGIALDAGGNAYLAGRTTSSDFTTTAGAYSTDSSTGGFITKLDATGGLVYSTYFGAGTGTTEIRGIAVDGAGSAYVSGGTPSSAVTGTDVFVAKISTNGSAALYTSFIRGARDDSGNGIAIDASGNVSVTGQTASTNFTTTSGASQPAFAGGPAFRSSDAAATWSPGTGISATSLYALVAAATTPTTLYAAADDETTGGVFKSTDNGATWTPSSEGLTDPRIHALAVDPITPATIYAGSRTLGVFKSVSGGANWTPTTLTNVFVTAIVVDPASSATVYAGTAANGVYKSVNGGSTWSPVNNGLLSLAVRTLAINPVTTGTLYAGTASGVYKTTNGGATWTTSNAGILDPDINAIIIDPRNPNLIFAATNTVGIFRSLNGGAFWLTANSGLSGTGNLASALTLDSITGTFYAAIGEANVSRLFKSANGITWTPTTLATARMSAIAVDRINPSLVHTATVGGMDAFVAKWNADGVLTYSTYLGGYRDDSGSAVAVDATGNAFVTGNTSSANFPSVAAMQATFGGGSESVTDAFITRLNSDGTAILYSSYIGGSSNDFGRSVAVDASGAAYVAGVTGSGDFPNVTPLSARPGLLDAFIAKITDTSVTSYAVPARGGVSMTSLGGTGVPSVGYGRVQPGVGSTAPSGLAIFGFRQNDVLVSEAAVPASGLITSGRIYAEIAGPVNTGIAIANPNDQPVTLTFYFTSSTAQSCAGSSTIIDANNQIAKFLSDAPFSCGALTGTFTFTASAPVSVIALRGLTNERLEFLITTLPVADLSIIPTTDVVVFPHFADGGGWTTQVVMVNPTEDVMTGSVQFYGQGGGTTPGQPVSVTIDGVSATTFAYSIPARGSRALKTSGLGTDIQAGSVRVIPDGASRTPSGLGIFNYRNVSEAGVPALRAGPAFRLYAESAGNFNASAVGSMQTGVAIANAAATAATVNFELTSLTGSSTGMTGAVTVPANGQIAMFLGQIQGFSALPVTFQGVLRVSTSAADGISIVGLRGRYNERRDFLITTTSPALESAVASSEEFFFPHFADSGGYTTQFILFNGATDQSSSGSLRFFTQSGNPLNLPVR